MPDQDLSLEPGTHACHFFRSFSEQKEVILPFFRAGVANGEHCLYITSEQSVDDWYFEFQAYGIDVMTARSRGALLVIPGEDWCRSGSDFNSVVKSREALTLLADLLDRFPGVRIAGDATWALTADLATDKLCHWEATANLVYQGLSTAAICQYNLDRHSAQAVHAALRTHPVAILNGAVYHNPHNEAQRILEHEPHLNQSDAEWSLIERLLAELSVPIELPTSYGKAC